MFPIIRRRRITAASPTSEKLATFLRHLEESGSVSFAARRTGIGRNTAGSLRPAETAANTTNTPNTNRIEDALVSFLACLKGPICWVFQGAVRERTRFGAV